MKILRCRDFIIKFALIVFISLNTTLSEANETSCFKKPTLIKSLGGNNELIINLCGNKYKVYDSNGNRDAYQLKNGKLIPACDKNWINYERDSFLNLYKKHDYNFAYKQLKFYLQKCNNQIPPQKKLWIENDLALAMQKSGNITECIRITTAMETNPHYAFASKALKNAVEYNIQQCTSDSLTPGKLDKPKGNKEYAWLLDTTLSAKEKNDLFVQFISQITPEETPTTQFTNNFKRIVLGGTEPPAIKDGRYGISSTVAPSDPSKRGILWVDTHRGTSIVGFIGEPFIVLTSKFYNVDNYPQKAKQDIKELCLKILKEQHQDPATKKIAVYDTATEKGIVLPFLWFDGTQKYLESETEKETYDKPERTVTTDLGPNRYNFNQRKKLVCSIYPHFAVLNLYDETTVKANVHHRLKNTAISDLCSKEFTGKKISFDGGVSGVVNNFLILPSMSFNINAQRHEAKIQIFDVFSGKKIFSTEYDWEKPFNVIRKEGKVGVSYYYPMDIMCNPTKNNPTCWQEILKKNNVDPAIKIPAPNCELTYKARPNILTEYPDGSRLKIMARAYVSDITQPKMNFISGQPVCH